MSSRGLREKGGAAVTDATGRFRLRLFVAMMVVVALVTVISGYVVQHEMEADVRQNLDERFKTEFDAMLAVREANDSAVIERCREIVRSPRLHGAIEDNALDMLYSIADAELHRLLPMPSVAGSPGDAQDAGESGMFRVRGYRFLDENGAVIEPKERRSLDEVQGAEDASLLTALRMKKLPQQEEVGYVAEHSSDVGTIIHQVVATPIVSSETGQPIAALVLLFKSAALPARLAGRDVRNGIWVEGHLDLPGALPGVVEMVKRVMVAEAGKLQDEMELSLDGAPYLLHFRNMNPGTAFRPGVLVSLFPLAASRAQIRSVRWKMIGAGGLLLSAGLLASHLLSARFSVPVEELAIVSSTHARQRDRAEAALEDTNEELRATNAELGTALTELKETQQRVIQQERLRALGQMASGVAHDFNNALVPILGFTELLQLSPGALADREKAMSYLNIISTAAGDAAKVVSRLRQFYRKHEDGEDFEPVDLAKLATQAITLTRPRWKDQAQAAGATVRVESELAPVPPVLGDESELREVLTNLIFNAVDAMPAGGVITVRTHALPDAAVLEVSDTGVGMTEEIRTRCLEPFFSTKGERGTGLGLSMVFGIVQRHRGSVDIRSSPGVGTTFIVTLPVPGADAGGKSSAANGVRVAQALDVLVVDDEPQVRDFVAAALGMDGHRVATAPDGAVGLKRFRDGHFDLVITDKAMPGMTGDQMASAMKLMKPGTPIILLTGFGQFLDKADLPGIDVLLSKPVGVQKLREALAAVFPSR